MQIIYSFYDTTIISSAFCIVQAALKSGKKLPASTLTKFKHWAAKEGLPENAGDHIVATGEVTINDGQLADKATSHRLLDVSFIHAHRQALI